MTGREGNVRVATPTYHPPSIQREQPRELEVDQEHVALQVLLPPHSTNEALSVAGDGAGDFIEPSRRGKGRGGGRGVVGRSSEESECGEEVGVGGGDGNVMEPVKGKGGRRGKNKRRLG